MDIKLREIVSKAAGTHFIVSDKSAVATIEAVSNLRVIFINSEQGPVNILVKFAQGDTASFFNVFGRGTRSMEKKGNFSISTCVDALRGGPIGVVNLRTFDDLIDMAGICGLNSNIKSPETGLISYSNLFNRNGFWSIKPENIANSNIFSEQHLLNFGVVGTSNMSIFVVKSNETSVALLTEEGDNTLVSTQLEIEDFPGLNPNMLVKDTFVDVYVFKNTFTSGSSTNQYYGQLFDSDGNIDTSRLNELSQIQEAGFVRRHVGSLIPGLKSELNQTLSIDEIINQFYPSDGIICSINEDVLESSTTIIDFEGVDFFDETHDKIAGTSEYLLSHVVPIALTTDSTTWPLATIDDNVAPLNANLIEYGTEKIDDYSFIGSFQQGLRIGNVISGIEGNVSIINMEILDDEAIIGATTDVYTKVKYTCNGPILFTDSDTVITKKNFFINSSLCKPTALISYKPRAEQFTNGSSARQNDILDMINSPSIVKGLRSAKGIAYVIDAFKSFVEPSYKYQFGQLMVTLDESNKFVRGILNDILVDDLQSSTNPLYADMPNGTFDWTYVPEGGNKTYSSILVDKPAIGESFVFYYGCDNKVGNIIKPIAGLASNLYVNKSMRYDIIANETGYIDGLTEVINIPDDTDRISCEKFRYNPIIDLNGFTIYGNLTAQKKVTKQQQIHNSELLAYIKENLYNLAKGDAFRKGTYDNYLKTETETTDFMESLVLAGTIEPNPVVKCDAENNTPEIAGYKIKLVHVEYFPLNSLEKVVFDLNIR